MDTIPKYDTLGLYSKSLYIRQTLEEGEEVFYSCNVEKYNRYGFTQERILLITNFYLVTLDFGPFNYNLHRKVPIESIDACVTSKLSTCSELVVHFKDDYDERYLAKKHARNIVRILQRIMTVRGLMFKVYTVPDKKLRNYATTKDEAAKGKDKRPDEKFLTEQTTGAEFEFDQVVPDRRPTLAGQTEEESKESREK